MKDTHGLCEVCRHAWEKNLLPGFGGNASVKTDQGILITASGTPKGFLDASGWLLVDAAGKILEGSGRPSSESLLHLAVYRQHPECRAILHTHPACLQALALKTGNLQNPANQERFLKLPLVEAEIWRKSLFFAPPLPAGSREVAEKAAKAWPEETGLPIAIWLENHGLVACGNNLLECLCLSEEMEHMARIQLLSGAV